MGTTTKEAFRDTGCIDTMPLTHWLAKVHDATIAAVGVSMRIDGVATETGEWLRTAQAERLRLMFRTGEPIWMAADSMSVFAHGAQIACDEGAGRRAIRACFRRSCGVA